MAPRILQTRTPSATPLGSSPVIRDGTTHGQVVRGTGGSDDELVQGAGSVVNDPDVADADDESVDPDEPAPEEPPELLGDDETVTVPWLETVEDPSSLTVTTLVARIPPRADAATGMVTVPSTVELATSRD